MKEQPFDSINTAHESPRDLDNHEPDLGEVIGAIHADPISDPKKDHKKKITLLGLFVALIGAAFLARAIDHNPTSSLTPPTPPAIQTPQKEVAGTEPYAFVYTTKQAGKKTDKCASDDSQISIRPLVGGKSSNANKLKAGYVNDSDTFKNRVLLVTSGDCGSDKGPSILFSRNSGKTYTEVYTGAPANKEGWQDQITSAKFASDGKSIVIASLLADRSKNIVKEINVDTKDVKELFSIKKAGLFIEGYDAAKKQLYYYDGCYNCDGNTLSKLSVHDIVANTDTVLFDTPKIISETTVASKDFSKFLIVKGKESENFLGSYPPFTIEEFDVATKTFKILLTFNKDVLLNVGYSEEGSPWYTLDKKLFSLSSAAAVDATKAPVLYEASKPIYDVYYVSKDRVIAGIGDYNKLDLIDYVVSSRALTNVFSGDENTRVYGLSWK